MARLYFEWAIAPYGGTVRLMSRPLIGRPTSVPVEDWADCMFDQAFSGVSRILALVDEMNGSVEQRDGGVFASHDTIASLTEPQAVGLGLPSSVPYALQVETKNLITDPDFRVFGRWVGEGNRPIRTEREGALLSIEGRKYRLPEPLYSLIAALDEHTETDTSDDDVRMERLAHLQALIPLAAQEQLRTDSYFASFRIMHASAFSLNLPIQTGSFDFDPILFVRKV